MEGAPGSSAVRPTAATSVAPQVPWAAGSGAGSSERTIASILEQCLSTAPLRAACEGGDLPKVRQAFKSIGPRAKGARSALQAAVAKGQAQVIRYLLQEGVPAEPPSPRGIGNPTAEQRAESAPYAIQAALSGSAEALRALADHGLTLTERGHAAVLERGHGARAAHAALVTTAAGAAAWSMQLEALEAVAALLVGAPSMDGIDAPAELKPWSPPDRVRSAPGRPQEFAWAQGATPLLLAMYAGGRAAAEGDAYAEAATCTLLRHLADPGAKNAVGETALHVAARFGLSRAVSALLEGGADVSQKNAQGDTAEAVALRAGRTACVEAIRGAPAVAAAPPAVTLVEQDEAAERARLERLREKQREKKGRQRERQRAQKGSAEGPEGAEGPETSAAGGAGADAAGEEEPATAAAAAPQRPAGSGPKPDPKLGCEALRERIASAQRERTRLLRQLKQTARRRDEERSRAEQGEAALAELQGRSTDLMDKVVVAEAKAREAERGERGWRGILEETSKDRALAQVAAAQMAEAHVAEVEKLRAELQGTLKNGNNGDGPGSFESERSRRVTAEERGRELMAQLEASVSSLLPVLDADDLPDLFEYDEDPRRPRLRVASAEIHRQLHAQQRQHLRDMRDLVSALTQQIWERDLELQAELDGVLGSGLPALLEALKAEGLVRAFKRPAPDPSRTARLQAALLKF